MRLTDLIRLAPANARRSITIRALVTPFKNRSLGKFTLICFDRGGGGGAGGVIAVWGGGVVVVGGAWCVGGGGCCWGGGWWWCGLTGPGGWGGGGGHPPRPERLPTTFLRTLGFRGTSKKYQRIWRNYSGVNLEAFGQLRWGGDCKTKSCLKLLELWPAWRLLCCVAGPLYPAWNLYGEVSWLTEKDVERYICG